MVTVTPSVLVGIRTYSTGRHPAIKGFHCPVADGVTSSERC